MSGGFKLGAEPKKMAILGALLVAAAGIYFYNSRDTEGAGAGRPSAMPKGLAAKLAQQQEPAGGEADAETATKGPAAGGGLVVAREFRPTMKRKGAALNPEQFDPTLRTDLLDKLAAVKIEHVERSLFDFSTAPEHPALPDPRITVQKQEAKMIGPEPPPPPPAPPVKPPPPPITLKFYGRALPLKGGVKRVFCMINDEVKIPTEGEILQRRYRVVKINPTSVVVEDIQNKNQQQLPIEEPAPGS